MAKKKSAKQRQNNKREKQTKEPINTSNVQKEESNKSFVEKILGWKKKWKISTVISIISTSILVFIAVDQYLEYREEKNKQLSISIVDVDISNLKHTCVIHLHSAAIDYDDSTFYGIQGQFPMEISNNTDKSFDGINIHYSAKCSMHANGLIGLRLYEDVDMPASLAALTRQFLGKGSKTAGEGSQTIVYSYDNVFPPNMYLHMKEPFKFFPYGRDSLVTKTLDQSLAETKITDYFEAVLVMSSKDTKPIDIGIIQCLVNVESMQEFTTYLDEDLTCLNAWSAIDDKGNSTPIDDFVVIEYVYSEDGVEIKGYSLKKSTSGKKTIVEIMNVATGKKSKHTYSVH